MNGFPHLVECNIRTHTHTYIYIIYILYIYIYDTNQWCKVFDLHMASAKTDNDIERWKGNSQNSVFLNNTNKIWTYSWLLKYILDARTNTCSIGIWHYSDVIMGTIASQITSVSIVYLTVSTDIVQRKHQSYASLAFVRGIHRGPVNSTHKWPIRRKMFPFQIMTIWPFCMQKITFGDPETSYSSHYPICQSIYRDLRLGGCDLGAVSIRCFIARSRETSKSARLCFESMTPLWHYTSTSTSVPRRRLSNFRASGNSKYTSRGFEYSRYITIRHLTPILKQLLNLVTMKSILPFRSIKRDW